MPKTPKTKNKPHKTEQRIIVTGPLKVDITVDYEFEDCCESEGCAHRGTKKECRLFGKVKLVTRKSKDDGEIELYKRHKQCLAGTKTR